MHYESATRTRVPWTPPTKSVTVSFLIGNEENFRTLKATNVIPRENGTLTVQTPGSTVTFKNWISFEER